MGKYHIQVGLRILITTLSVSVFSACSSQKSTDAKAEDDHFDVGSGVLLIVSVEDGVLFNDIGSKIVASIATKPEHREGFSFSEEGAFNFLATVEQTTTDQFRYQITASNGTIDEAIVTLTIHPAPLAQTDAYTVVSDSTLVASAEQGVLRNDSSDRELVAELINLPSQSATFSLQPDGSFQYKPLPGFSGEDGFSYSVSDGLQSSDPVSVKITVGAPAVNVDNLSVVSGRAVSLSGPAGILGNDFLTDVGWVVELVRLPEKAIDFSLDESGHLIYRTINSNVTSDRFSYRVITDSQTLGPVDVNLSIEQPPLSEEPPGGFDNCMQYPFSQNVSGTLTASGVDSPTFELISQPRLGALTGFDAASGQFSYQRSSSARGQDSFSYKVLNADLQTVAHATMELIAEPYRVMPVGDSITSGVELFNGTEDTPASNVRVGYRKALKDMLSSEGYSIDLVGTRSEGKGSGLGDSEHNGFPGQDDRFVRDSIQQWLDQDAADIILMHIGTNGTKSHTNHLASAADTIDTWERQNHKVTLMQAKIIARADNQSRADRVVNFNNLIDSFINNRKNGGDRIFEVDQFQVIPNGNLLSADLLHPESEGYAKMAQRWKDRLIATGALKRCD